MQVEERMLSKHGLDHVQLLLNLLDIHSEFIMESNIFQYSSLKIWYDISLENFHSLVDSSHILEINNK